MKGGNQSPLVYHAEHQNEGRIPHVQLNSRSNERPATAAATLSSNGYQRQNDNFSPFRASYSKQGTLMRFEDQLIRESTPENGSSYQRIRQSLELSPPNQINIHKAQNETNYQVAP